jgi:hypothetical protein
MKLSSVWTVCVVLAVIVLASGCAGHRVVNLKPMNPVVHPEIASPAPDPHPAATVPAATYSVAAYSPVIQSVETQSRSGVQTNLPPVQRREIPITEAPPPLPVEVVGAAPGADYVWISGTWQWRGRWVWSGGFWEVQPQPGAVWIKGRWVKRDKGWVWIRGYWR